MVCSMHTKPRRALKYEASTTDGRRVLGHRLYVPPSPDVTRPHPDRTSHLAPGHTTQKQRVRPYFGPTLGCQVRMATEMCPSGIAGTFFSSLRRIHHVSVSVNYLGYRFLDSILPHSTILYIILYPLYPLWDPLVTLSKYIHV
jgi:hypothetical protein